MNEYETTNGKADRASLRAPALPLRYRVDVSAPRSRLPRAHYPQTLPLA